MSRHTPGPWKVEWYGDGFYKIYEAQEQLDPDDGNAPENAEAIDTANADLIAAAPDMLTMLQELSAWLVCPDTSPETVQHIKARIDSLLKEVTGAGN